MRLVAEELEREVKREWPVDSGRSRRGLWTEVRGRDILFFNKWNYAYWVEKRWFPLRPFVAGRLRRIISRVERRLSDGT